MYVSILKEVNSMAVCSGVTWLRERPWSKSVIHITGKRPYKLCWDGLGFLPCFLFSFCLLLSQELWKSEFHPSKEEKKKVKLLVGQDILVPVLWVCMSLWEMCKEKKARSRCLCGLWQGGARMRARDWRIPALTKTPKLEFVRIRLK